MTVTAHKPTIVAPVRPESFGSDCFEVVARVFKVREEGYFLAVPLSMLWKHSEFVGNLIEQYGKPKIFFIVADADYNLLLEKQKQQPWKALVDRMLLLKEWSDVARVMHAWGCHMEKETIATAFVEGDSIVVIDCRLRRLAVKFDQLTSLAVVEESERANFEIGEWGEHLFWPKYDLHVDIIDSILYRTDPDYQKKKDLAALTQNKEYGQAILALRKEFDLTREDIESMGEISAKTVQRVESGQAELSVKTFEALAQAHKMSANVYLHRLSEIVRANALSATFSAVQGKLAICRRAGTSFGIRREK